jgi:UDP-3-O-[3-hydroxymyristoyl] glucosamine N-acyltransferase
MLSAIGAAHQLQLVGPDRVVTAYGPLTTISRPVDELLTYVSSADYLEMFVKSKIAACVLPEGLATELPSDRSALIATVDAAETFYTIFCNAVINDAWTSLPNKRGSGSEIASSASVANEGVVIGEGCTIMDNAVILPQTYISDEVVVEPHAVIGGNGFQLATLAGRPRLVPHAGGVFLGDRVSIGSQTCIDRGLFGEFTTIGADTHIDNLVHIAHSVTVGQSVSIVACAEVSGSVVIDDGAWLAPSCAINPGLHVGKHSLVGTGSTVVSDIEEHAIAYGSPARVHGRRCSCGKSFPLEGAAYCGDCGWEA